MILTFQAPEGQPAYHIDAGALNNELAAALGGWCNGWSASHNASQAIVTLSPEREGDAALVGQVVAAHVANTAVREARNAILANIATIEKTYPITHRFSREQTTFIFQVLLALVNKVNALDAEVAVLAARAAAPLPTAALDPAPYAVQVTTTVDGQIVALREQLP